MSRKLLLFPILSFSFIPCMEINQYQQACKQIIDQRNAELEHYKTTLADKDLVQEEENFRAELVSYKRDLLSQKQNALNDIKKRHQIDDTAWKLCMLTLNDIEVVNKDKQHLRLPNVSHDSNVPEYLLEWIKERLTNKGINPERINIRGKENAFYFYKSRPVRLPNIPKIWPGCSEDKNSHAYALLGENIMPGKITLNLNAFSLLSKYAKGALVVRMVEEIVQNAHFPYIIITTFASLSTYPDSIINSPELKNFNNLCKEKLPVFLPSFDGLVVATCMLLFYTECCSPDFTIDDYELLSKIQKNWRAISFISKLMNPDKTENI